MKIFIIILATMMASSASYAEQAFIRNKDVIVGKKISSSGLYMSNLRGLRLFGMSKRVDSEIDELSFRDLYICDIDGRPEGAANIYKVYAMKASSCEIVNEAKFIRLLGESLEE